MDERWVAIACFSDAEWTGLTSAMSDPEWALDAKFSTHAARKENEDQLDANINAWTADKDPYEIMQDLQARGVPAGVVQSARELLDVDAHIKDRGYYVYLDHPEAGHTAYDGPPAVLTKTPGKLQSPAPMLGEHTEHVCKNILGLTDEEITELLVAGALS